MWPAIIAGLNALRGMGGQNQPVMLGGNNGNMQVAGQSRGLQDLLGLGMTAYGMYSNPTSGIGDNISSGNTYGNLTSTPQTTAGALSLYPEWNQYLGYK